MRRMDSFSALIRITQGRHSHGRSTLFWRVEQLVHTEIGISTPKFPYVDRLGPTGLSG